LINTTFLKNWEYNKIKLASWNLKNDALEIHLKKRILAQNFSHAFIYNLVVLFEFSLKIVALSVQNETFVDGRKGVLRNLNSK
jgi:hypothetical protein